jgi:hypothetical protein
MFAALAVGSALADAAIGIGQTGTPIQANKQRTGSAQELPSGCSQSGTTVSCTFTYTGAAQGFTVPAGVGSVTVAAFGAQGGRANLSDGGLGGEARATLSVNAEDVLEVLVGGQGGIYTRGDGGFNGGGVGGAAGTGGVGGGGGGGASDVRAGSCAGALSCDLSARVLVAGGGGGSGLGGGSITGQGGAGAYTTGGRGASGTAGGGGGGQRVSRESAGTADSSGDCPVAPTDGTAGGTVTQDAGGAGGAGGQVGSGEPGNRGGGGGGGYWGGGGGGGSCSGPLSGGGGGGSSFGPAGATFTNATKSGGGQVTITYTVPGLTTTNPGVGVKPTVIKSTSAIKVAVTSATLKASLIPGRTTVKYHFEYGISKRYGKSTMVKTLKSSTKARSISSLLKGLHPGTKYHFRMVATNSTTTVRSRDRTFTTRARIAVTGLPRTISKTTSTVVIRIHAASHLKVKHVTVLLGHRRIASTHKAKLTLRLAASKLPIGVHTITVITTGAGGTTRQTLRFSVASGLSAFTG